MVGDKLAIRVAGQIVDHDGYLTDGHNDEDSEAFRLGLLYQASENTSLLVTGSHATTGGKGEAGVIVERFVDTPSPYTDPSNPWAGITDPETISRFHQSNPGNEGFLSDQGFTDLEVNTLAATLEHDMDWATLTVIPSYVAHEQTELNHAATAVPGYTVAESETVSLEARLSSASDSDVKWVVGAYWSEESIDEELQSKIPFGDIFPLLFGGMPDGISEGVISTSKSPNRDTEAVAIFGEATFNLADDLRLITGLRYTKEEKSNEGGSTYSYAFPFGPPVVSPTGHFESVFDFPLVGNNFPTANTPGALDISANREDSETNYRLGLEYDVSDDSMLYAVVASGFKAGGFFASLPSDNAYEPEELTAYTIGSKNRFLDDRLQVNAEAFYWDYTNKQETFLGDVPGFGSVLQTRNAGEVTLKGLELSIVGQLTENDLLSLYVEYVDSEYDTFKYIKPSLGGAAPFGNCTLTNVDTSGNGMVDSQETNCSGNPLVRAPEVSGRLAYTRHQPIGDSGNLIFGLSMSFASDYFLASDFSALQKQPSHELFDAYLSWEPSSDKWSITAWMKNIADDNVYASGTQSAILNDATTGHILPPRTYGIRARYNF